MGRISSKRFVTKLKNLSQICGKVKFWPWGGSTLGPRVFTSFEVRAKILA